MKVDHEVLRAFLFLRRDTCEPQSGVKINTNPEQPFLLSPPEISLGANQLRVDSSDFTGNLELLNKCNTNNESLYTVGFWVDTNLVRSMYL